MTVTVAMSVNLDACIQCGLCVRACREVQVNDVIGMSGRGQDAYPTFDLADPMGDSTCVACGECVQACPTGALMPSTVVDDAQVGDSKDFDTETESVCPFCGVGCQGFTQGQRWQSEICRGHQWPSERRSFVR